MLEVESAVVRRSVSRTDKAVPPRPKWLPKRQHDSRYDLDQAIDVADVPLERKQSWQQDTTAFLVSLSLHVMVLLVIWQVFRFVMEPVPTTYVISTEFDSKDGTETELLTLVDSPVPQSQPVANLAGAVAITETMAGDTQFGGHQPIVGGGGGVGFFGAEASGDSVVFVVDKSGSMSHGGRMEAAKLELANALQQLRPYQRFYVIFYSNEADRMLAPSSPEALLPASQQNLQDVIRWISEEVKAGGGTQPRDSLLAALEMEPDIIFFLTDGDVDGSTAATVHLHNGHGTIIHTLCLSEDYGETVMQRIAHENRGRYRFVETYGPSSEARSPQSIQEEKIADVKLRTALRHLDQGRTRTGQRWLVKLIKDHPGTPQAREAQQKLISLGLTP